MNRTNSVAAITGAFLVTAVMASYPTTASAHGGNADPSVIHACVQQSSNQVRIVGANGACTNAETAVHWGLIGQQGTQGVKGDQGTQGIQGIQGAQGVNGDKGEQGIQGSQGANGDKGEQGNQGVQGAKGDTGDQGVKGDAGETGAQGPQGDQGIQGIQGEKGAQGIAGPSSGALIFAQQFTISPPPSAGGGVITVNVNLPKPGTVLVQASGTAWCAQQGFNDLWVAALVDGVKTGTLNGGVVNCEGGKRRALTSLVTAVSLSAGSHTITFAAGPATQYDDEDRWNVTVLEYSN